MRQISVAKAISGEQRILLDAARYAQSEYSSELSTANSKGAQFARSQEPTAGGKFVMRKGVPKFQLEFTSSAPNTIAPFCIRHRWNEIDELSAAARDQERRLKTTNSIWPPMDIRELMATEVYIATLDVDTEPHRSLLAVFYTQTNHDLLRLLFDRQPGVKPVPSRYGGRDIEFRQNRIP